VQLLWTESHNCHSQVGKARDSATYKFASPPCIFQAHQTAPNNSTHLRIDEIANPRHPTRFIVTTPSRCLYVLNLRSACTGFYDEGENPQLRHPLRARDNSSEHRLTIWKQSHKTFRTKQKLAKAQKQNRPIPQWIRLRTGNTIRYEISSQPDVRASERPGRNECRVRSGSDGQRA